MEQKNERYKNREFERQFNGFYVRKQDRAQETRRLLPLTSPVRTGRGITYIYMNNKYCLTGIHIVSPGFMPETRLTEQF